MTVGAPSKPYHRLHRIGSSWTDGWDRLGDQTYFYGQTIRGIRDVFANYRVELVRLIVQMSLGTGALAVIGGLVFATVATLMFVPVVFSMVHKKRAAQPAEGRHDGEFESPQH